MTNAPGNKFVQVHFAWWLHQYQTIIVLAQYMSSALGLRPAKFRNAGCLQLSQVTYMKYMYKGKVLKLRMCNANLSSSKTEPGIDVKN